MTDYGALIMASYRDAFPEEDPTIWRDPLALVMIAAWVGAPSVDKLPKEMRAHTCPATAKAWTRVADAARAFIAQEQAG